MSIFLTKFGKYFVFWESQNILLASTCDVTSVGDSCRSRARNIEQYRQIVEKYRQKISTNCQTYSRSLSNKYNAMITIRWQINTGKTSAIWRTAVRENCVSSRHHRGTVEGLLETLRTTQHYRIEGFKGGPLMDPQYVSFSSPLKKCDRIIYSTENSCRKRFFQLVTDIVDNWHVCKGILNRIWYFNWQIWTDKPLYKLDAFLAK